MGKVIAIFPSSHSICMHAAGRLVHRLSQPRDGFQRGVSGPKPRAARRMGWELRYQDAGTDEQEWEGLYIRYYSAFSSINTYFM